MSTLHIGVIGAGKIEKRTVVALLADRLTDETPHFYIPVTTDHWSQATRAVAQYALQRELPYDVIVDGSEDEVEAVEEVLTGAANTHKVAVVEDRIVKLLAATPEEDTAIVLLAWDDSDDACQRTLARAEKRGLKAFDLCDGMNDLSFDDSPAPAAEEPAATLPPPAAEEVDEVEAIAEAEEVEQDLSVAEEAPAEKPKRTRRTKAQMEAARAAEAERAEAITAEATVVDVTDAATADEAQTEPEHPSEQPASDPLRVFGFGLYDLLEAAAEAGAAKALAAAR